jgi:CheY-like chemotaxis protein
METNILLEERPVQQSILLVDDDEDDRFIMNGFFEVSGYQRTVLTSGKEALQLLHALSPLKYPSVIIVDYNMPYLTGEEILKQIKSDEKLSHIPLIVYSSEMTEWLKNRLLTLGALHCFKKEYNRQQFSCLQYVLDEILHRNFCPV